jgi:hypothetical protein
MTHPDLENLMNAMLPFAQKMLAKRGQFYSYGSTMTIDGQVVAQAAYEGEQPTPEQLIHLMTQTFRQQAAEGKLRAAGICYDVLTVPPGKTQKTDAICVGLEHQSGQTVSVFLPYKKGVVSL